MLKAHIVIVYTGGNDINVTYTINKTVYKEMRPYNGYHCHHVV